MGRSASSWPTSMTPRPARWRTKQTARVPRAWRCAATWETRTRCARWSRQPWSCSDTWICSARTLARGAGYLLHTCSAAGLLTNPGDAPYTVSKHAAVAFAEWLAVTYGDKGVRISVLCPQGVRTNMLLGGLQEGNAAARAVAAAGELLEPEQVADAVVEGLDAERFLILPHSEVATYLRRKAEDPDRWLAGMRRLVAGASAPGAASGAAPGAAGASVPGSSAPGEGR